jgi:CBS domain-containing protein
MREPAVAEVMTPRVMTAVPDSLFKELVATMIAHDVDALPVIGPSGRPVGIVTETDVMAKLEFFGGADNWPLLGGSRARRRWRKASGLTAAQVMTAPALVVARDAPLTVAVRMLATHRLHQLCVVDRAGHLVGMLTRRDALRLFLRGDGAIVADLDQLLASTSKHTDQIVIDVTDGIVTVSGTVGLRSTAAYTARNIHHIPGVIAVRNDLHYEVDDLTVIAM